MTFVQATTGGGGWPMSVWLTPELKPFFGGTYFPPENRYGHPGFASVLTQLASAWRSRARANPRIRPRGRRAAQEDTSRSPRHIGARRRSITPSSTAASSSSAAASIRASAASAARPSFRAPRCINFLLRYYARTKNQEALDMVLLTLREMAKGGMNDQLGGGFHRYSVDERWFVPHFEKMLYDQAQLAISYLEAFQITGDAQYADTARRIFDYVLRDMTDSGRRILFGRRCRQRHRSGGAATTRAKARSTSGPRRRFASCCRPAGRRLVLLPLWRRRARQCRPTIRTSEFTGKNILLPGAHHRGDRGPFRRSGGRSPRRASRKPSIAVRGPRPARAPAPGRQDPHRLERPHDFGLRPGRRGA